MELNKNHCNSCEVTESSSGAGKPDCLNTYCPCHQPLICYGSNTGCNVKDCPTHGKCTAGCCSYDDQGNKIGMCGLNTCNHPHCHDFIGGAAGAGDKSEQCQHVYSELDGLCLECESPRDEHCAKTKLDIQEKLKKIAMYHLTMYGTVVPVYAVKDVWDILNEIDK